MIADEYHGAGEAAERRERLHAVLQETNGHHSDLASHSCQQAPPSTSTPSRFSSSVSESIGVSSTDVAHSSVKTNLADAEGTDNGSIIAGSTVGDEGKHRLEISATPTFSMKTRATSRQDIVPEPQTSALNTVSPKSPPRLHSLVPSLRPPSSPRNRDRGFSLRKAILARNIHGQSESSGSAMELQPRASPEEEPAFADANVIKKSEATIIVEPVPFLETHPQSIKEAREISALPRYETWIKSKAAHTGLLSRFWAAKERARKNILRIREIPPSKHGRHVDVKSSRREPLIDERTGRRYMNNTITSSRYTLYNFLPRQLFAQFSKLANFYFLCVSILQMIPGLSTTGTYTTIVPLAFFVIISMAKEGYDDLRRYRLDKAENRKIALVLRELQSCASHTETLKGGTATFGEQVNGAMIKWGEISVGDIVKLKRDEAAPADLVVLHTTGAEGMAYVETMALDGETNLKSKQALPQLAWSCRNEENIANCKAQLVVEDPNLDLYNFDGRVTIGDETLPLGNNEIIYRGSVLRNTSEAIGIVVYTGEECKIRMNATKNPRIKAVSIETTPDTFPNMAPADTHFLACSSKCSEQGCCHARCFRGSFGDFQYGGLSNLAGNNRRESLVPRGCQRCLLPDSGIVHNSLQHDDTTFSLCQP